MTQQKLIMLGIKILLIALCLVSIMRTECNASFTPIRTIQGNGAETPVAGQTFTVKGVVVGDFQETGKLSGFFVQQEDADTDSDETTSEGIFVYSSSFPVNEGDLVSVTGQAVEYYGLTELKNITNVTIISTGNTLPTPAKIELPLINDTWLERFEGMRITLPQKLTVSDNSDVNIYGCIVLSNGRIMSPTEIAAPGADADKIEAANSLNRIILDDASYSINPEPIIFPQPGLSADNTLRTGYTVTGLTGVLDYSYDHYRIHATVHPVFDTSANPRAVRPDTDARLKIASFNVMNFFNGPVFPTSRGADTYTEFVRQRTKIINAIAAMAPDIIGLVEIENDGYQKESAIWDMTESLNAAVLPGNTYAFADPGLSKLGSDEITVGLLYKKETVMPVGKAATKNDGAFAAYNRQPLAQTFREIVTNEQLTVVVNHFKSKSTPCPNDPDQNDGQGNCSMTRSKAATELITWLASYPTGVDDPDILITGDLNAYTKEDPITVIENSGYTNLLAKNADKAYSYVYKGKAGCLDHAMSSKTLTPQVTDTAVWHINADEPHFLDYNEENKTDYQKTLYSKGPYRSSDHDPILVGLNLSGKTDLDNAVSILKILAGVKNTFYSGQDINNDGIAGFEELIYILQSAD
ncbi:MAG: ExeM/NucH family extracellular endonuclease [Desulfobacterales bacterium]|nr:ExeM/NucH family extracellular endonuclease [Desulfobacterales bacterium]